MEIQLSIPSCALVSHQLSRAGSTIGVAELLLLANCSDKHNKKRMLENKNSFNLTFRMLRHTSSEVTV